MIFSTKSDSSCELRDANSAKTFERIFLRYIALKSDKKSTLPGDISDRSNIPEASIFNAEFAP